MNYPSHGAAHACVCAATHHQMSPGNGSGAQQEAAEANSERAEPGRLDSLLEGEKQAHQTNKNTSSCKQ